MFLKQIDISQIRAIERVKLDFRTGKSAGNVPVRSRTVMVGDNGCGKSTVLRSIALLVAGRESLPGLLAEPAAWVRGGQREGRIKAVLGMPGKSADIEVSLTLRPSWTLRQTLSKNAKNLRLLDAALAQSAGAFFTLGYGASRRASVLLPTLAKADRGAAGNPRVAAMGTLFSTEAALASPEGLARVAQSVGGKTALRVLFKKLLMGASLDKINPATGELMFKTADGFVVSFGGLSDAQQTIAALCGDLLLRIAGAFPRSKAPLKTPGLLLLDELELHMHPLFQRTLVEGLMNALPSMQLIGTTQSPIVVQQLREGELVLLERTGPAAGANARVPEGDPSQLTLSQLMAPIFGIDTGDSARVAALRARARSSPARLAASEHTELAQLSPVRSLPAPLQAQLQATTALTEAIARSAGQSAPKLDLTKLRQKMGERIKSAALRVGGGP